jgi:putative ABC transport system ATP-binding protein
MSDNHRPAGFVIERLEVTRAGRQLLRALNASIPAGECTAVVGASGAGKTTLLRVLNRLEEPTRGRVLLDGIDLAAMDVLALRRRVGLVAQRPAALTDRVSDELRVGRQELSGRELTELLARVGLGAEFAGRTMRELSGGEAQRICLARALAVRPQVLLLDEPTSALDAGNTALISQLVRDHLASGGTTVLASHDLTLVRGLAHQILVLDHGRLAATAPPTDVDDQDIATGKVL